MERIFINQLETHIGKTITIAGWVHRVRKMSAKLLFIEIRDITGRVQVVADLTKLSDEAQEIIKGVKNEFCVAVEGVVTSRVKEQVRDGLNGNLEIDLSSMCVYSESSITPFEVNTEERQAAEELRLKYRYLDLRQERMQKNIRLRHDIVRAIREYFYTKNFHEIETPLLTRGTPEGAREFIVPSRPHKGNFYVLPQSPQQFKQLLMVAGFDRYFQIARCFRDEDQRGDRQPEFTQMDLEMSFVKQEDILQLIEKALISIVQKVAPEKTIQQIPFPRITYKEAMEKYGNDRPDIRTDKNNPNLLAFCWVVDFPFFEKTEEDGWTFTHNPFSAPQPQFHDDLMNKKNIEKILAAQYDIVLNGFEIGGGSIRNHESAALTKVFEIMGFSSEDIQSQFGHMLEAFKYGAPPHGGIAWGLDRIVALLAGEPNIREVIAFPKTSDARDLMMDAPSPLPKKALDDAGVMLTSDRPLFDRVIEDLNKHSISYELIEHAPVVSSDEAAAMAHTTEKEAAKSLVVKNKEKTPKFYLAVVPGDAKVDWSALAKFLNEKAITLATPEEVETLTGVPVGAVPPLGHLFRTPLKTIVADTLLSTSVILQPGRKDRTIRLVLVDVLKIVPHTIASFTK